RLRPGFGNREEVHVLGLTMFVIGESIALLLYADPNGFGNVQLQYVQFARARTSSGFAINSTNRLLCSAKVKFNCFAPGGGLNPQLCSCTLKYSCGLISASRPDSSVTLIKVSWVCKIGDGSDRTDIFIRSRTAHHFKFPGCCAFSPEIAIKATVT